MVGSPKWRSVAVSGKEPNMHDKALLAPLSASSAPPEADGVLVGCGKGV